MGSEMCIRDRYSTEFIDVPRSIRGLCDDHIPPIGIAVQGDHAWHQTRRSCRGARGISIGISRRRNIPDTNLMHGDNNNKQSGKCSINKFMIESVAPALQAFCSGPVLCPVAPLFAGLEKWFNINGTTLKLRNFWCPTQLSTI